MRNISVLFSFLLVLTGCQFFSSKKENKDPEFPKPDILTVPEREFAVSDDSDNRPFFYGGSMDFPEFPGGDAALIKFILNHTVYPASAIRDRVEGRVYVRFAVEKDGTVTVVDVARGVRDDLDKAALEVARQMPAWKPGKLDGELRRVIFTIPVNYSLNDLEAGKIRAEEVRSVKVYPNPTSGRISMEISESIPDLFYGVYDADGRMVKQGEMFSTLQTIDLSGLSNGIYIVRLSSETESFLYSERVVKR